MRFIILLLGLSSMLNGQSLDTIYATIISDETGYNVLITEQYSDYTSTSYPITNTLTIPVTGSGFSFIPSGAGTRALVDILSSVDDLIDEGYQADIEVLNQKEESYNNQLAQNDLSRQLAMELFDQKQAGIELDIESLSDDYIAIRKKLAFFRELYSRLEILANSDNEEEVRR